MADAGPWLARLTWVFCVCLTLLVSPSWGATTEITQLRAERSNDGVFLSAVVRFDLPPVVEDALTRGIPLFFVVETEVYRERWYWTDQQVASVARTLRVAYQPLTRKWRVNIAPGLISSSSGLRPTLNQNYDTLDEALATIQRVARWKIADAGDIDPDAPYKISLSFKLDLSQLPRPFQIGVAGQRDWAISAQRRENLVMERVAAEPATETPQ